MDNLIEPIRRRVNPSGQKEVVVRSRGADQVEIIVPEATDAEATCRHWNGSSAPPGTWSSASSRTEATTPK